MLMLFTFAALLALLAIGSHVAVAMGLVTTALVLMVEGVPLTVIAQTAFKSVNSYPLMAIPLFVLDGNLMMRGDIATLLIDLIGSLVRAVRGGLALTVMIACVFFAAISGSSVGSAAAIGGAVVSGLRTEGYPPRFAAGIVAVGGTLGLMIPPSLGFILIGSMVGLPVDRLFIAGVLPGLMESVLLLLAVSFLTRRHGYGRTTARPDWRGFAARAQGRPGDRHARARHRQHLHRLSHADRGVGVRRGLRGGAVPSRLPLRQRRRRVGRGARLGAADDDDLRRRHGRQPGRLHDGAHGSVGGDRRRDRRGKHERGSSCCWPT